MALSLTIKVNNKTEMPVRVTNPKPIISWDWTEDKIVHPDGESQSEQIGFIDQYKYEIRISNQSNSLGTNGFIGSLEDYQEISTSRQYRYKGPDIVRGTYYYGQIRVTDADNKHSPWTTFQFKYNRLPQVTSAAIHPLEPTPDDSLLLYYVFSDGDGDSQGKTQIRWFKNGLHQQLFDNQTVIDSGYISFGDIWSADIIPNDTYEFGPRALTDSVQIKKDAPVVEGLEILPISPNENDILRAKYDFLSESATDKSKIRWYVNEILQSSFNDSKYVRLDVLPGDKVRYELSPYDGVSYGQTLSSLPVTIISSGFTVNELRIDGQIEPLSLLSTRPTISWYVNKPLGKDVNYVSIRIGTFAGADNLYSQVLNTSSTSFQIPANLFQRGADYWISVAVSDTEIFDKYTIAHCRLTGSLWQESVSNTTGWTIEVVFAPVMETVYAENAYQIIRFQDGTKFGEVRIYADRISFASNTVQTVDSLTIEGLNALTITGQGSDAKIYLNNNLIIDASGDLVQLSDTKRLEIGTVTTEPLQLKYKTLFYTVNGNFEPGDSNWRDVQFYSIAEFEGKEVIGVKGFKDNAANELVIGVNPHDDNEGGSIYKRNPISPIRAAAVNKTYTPINKINLSVNEKFKCFSHARGGTLFYSYLINNWDNECNFSETQDAPLDKGWEFVNNAGQNIVNINEDGLTIDTSFDNIGSVNE